MPVCFGCWRTVAIRPTVPNSGAVCVRYWSTNPRGCRPVSDVDPADVDRVGSVCHSAVGVVRPGDPIGVSNHGRVNLKGPNSLASVANGEVIPARLEGNQRGD